MRTVLISPAPALLMGSLTSWLIIALLISKLRRYVLDNPNARSSHQIPTPSSGGIGFVLSGTCLAPLCGVGPMAWLPLMCFPLAVVGFWDDRVNLKAWPRFVAQILTAFAIIFRVHEFIPSWLWGPIILVIVGTINFINFTDGLDGLVALCSVIFFASAVLKNILVSGHASDSSMSSLWPLIGGLISFLLWNWSPAKVFMGDGGSTFLGAMIAGTVLHQKAPADAFALFMVAFPLLGDAGICLIRRVTSRQPIFAAHRLHLFQRLQRAGWSHGQVAVGYGMATVMLSGIYIFSGLRTVLIISGALLVCGYWLDKNIAFPFEDAGTEIM